MLAIDSMSLQSGESLVAGFRRHCDGLIERAVGLIRNPTADRGEDIHLVRTTIKELRAILRLIRPMIGAAAFRRENAYLRKTAQRLSAARDITAGQQALMRLLKVAISESDRLTLILVLDRYAKFAAPSQHASQEDALLTVDRALLASRLRLRKLRPVTRAPGAIMPGLQAVYHDCRERMNKAYTDEQDRDFHRWRIRVKNLFYELRWIGAAWPKRLCKMVKRLKGLQDQLGCDHDLTVLQGILTKTPEKFGGAPAVECVLRCVAKHRQRLRRSGRRLGTTIFRERPKTFVHRLERHWLRWHSGGA